MHTFRVWAPFAKKVEVETEGRRFPMRAEPDGWWSATVDQANAGSDYAFALDGERPLPDPRSPWQPHGMDAPSRLVDHASFKWTDHNFRAPAWERAVVYELHIGTFTPEGTFDAALKRLEHLVQLGVTHVEVMPVNEWAGDRGWGYDGVGLFATRAVYGGPEGFKRFVDACHARGLAVILDVVYNHLGPLGNHLARFGPYFNDRYKTFWGPALNYDGPHNEEVRRFFCDNARQWLRDYHCDALRLDAVHAILDTSAIPFLEQLSAEVRDLAQASGRTLRLIPESDLNDPRLLHSGERGGFALDAQWSDDFHHALHTVLTEEKNGYYADFGTLADLAKALRHAYVYDGRYSATRLRRHGRPADGLSGHRFLGYLQNHDQIGNRAQGDRSSHLLNVGRLKIGAAVVLTSPFVPMLFQGEEWAASTPFLYFTNFPGEDLGRMIRESRCREFAAFGWQPEEIPDAQAESTWRRSQLNWSELANGKHREMLAWHRRLIRLRRDEPALTDGRLAAVQTRFDEQSRWFVLERGPIVVAFNLANRTQPVPLLSGPCEVLLTSDDRIQVDQDTATLPPDSVVILKQHRPYASSPCLEESNAV